MILFVDDEARYMSSYLEELRGEFPQHEIMYQTKLDDALNVLKEDTDQIELLILDIMMPAGESLKDVDTRAGLRSGVFFYKLVRQIKPSLDVIILTNVSDPQVRDYFDKEEKCLFLQKMDYEPFELAEEVKDVLGGNIR